MEPHNGKLIILQCKTDFFCNEKSVGLAHASTELNANFVYD